MSQSLPALQFTILGETDSKTEEVPGHQWVTSAPLGMMLQGTADSQQIQQSGWTGEFT